MQTEVLESNPEADLHVYAVWMPLTRTDNQSAWNRDLLSDKRVIHFWDEGFITGYWFSEHISGQQPLAWDAYFLYGADATWAEFPEPLLGTGNTIIDHTEQLRSQLSALVER